MAGAPVPDLGRQQIARFGVKAPMDPAAALDPGALAIVVVAYVVIGLAWLTFALRTNRQS